MQFALINYFMSLMSVLNEVEIVISFYQSSGPPVWALAHLTTAYTAQTAIKPLRPIAKA